MRVILAELLPYSIPFRTPLDTARGPLRRRRGAILRLRTDLAVDPGVEGLGDFAPHPAASDEEVEKEWRTLSNAVREFPGIDVDRVESALVDAGALPPAARSAVVTALLDLRSRARGLPLRDEFGSGRRSSIEASALLERGSPDEAHAAARLGHRAVKLKADRDGESTVARVRAILRELPDLEIRVDANGAWGRAEACRVAADLRGLRGWIEQPVARGDVEGLAIVRRSGGTPVAADESVVDLASTAALLEAVAADVIVLKLSQVGGPIVASRIAAMAAGAGVQSVVTTGFDAGVATAAALHLAASIEGPLPACGLATAHVLASDLLRVPLDSGARMRLPGGPGIGVRLDADLLERHRVERP